MDYEQLQKYQHSILDRALAEAIRRNEEQTRIWSEYKSRHEKLIESLETFSQELSVECMVPIGKRALMRGKLTHTNEILVSLGEGYFAKYSASQATALCKRRIKKADDFLEGLEKELKLYEMRQQIPESFDAFASEGRKDLIEHWNDEQLDDWRAKHREREKEYRQELAKLKNVEKQDIKTEEDLFAKLDALELQEELEAELHRLEAECPDFYNQDLGEGEVYEESDDSSEESETEESSGSDESDSQNISTKSKVNFSPEATKVASDSGELVNEPRETVSQEKLDSSVDFANSPKVPGSAKKSVVFGEPLIKYFDEKEQITSSEENKSRRVPDAEDPSEDDVVRIEFTHSDHEPQILDSGNDESFQSPRDIYNFLSKPKPILKYLDNQENAYVGNVSSVGNLPTIDDSTDEEIDDNSAGHSTYNSVVKDIKEHVVDEPSPKPQDLPIQEKKPMSKFKRERMKR